MDYFPHGTKVEIRWEGKFKNGSYYGPVTDWYENGQKKIEMIYDDDGNIISLKEWNKDGSPKE